MKRIVAIMLVLLMLLPAVIACGNTPSVDDTAAGDGTSQTPEDTLPPEEEKEVIPRPDIAQENNNGEEFNVLHYDQDLLFSDDDTGDNVALALFERNAVIEEWLGIKITHFSSGNYQSVYPELMRSVMAQEDVYDMALPHTTQGIANMLSGKYVMDMNTIPHIDTTAPYWNQSSIALFEREGVLPFAVNDFLIPQVNVMLFNPELLENAGLPNPYEIVKNGEWTVDKLFEMAETVYADDGDGVKNEKDTFGLIMAPDWKVASIQHACGQMIIDNNEEGVPEYVIYSERMIDILEKVNTFFYGPNAYGTTDVVAMKAMFAAGQGLFYLESITETLTLRSTESDFGILPIPKWDVSQDTYTSTNWSGYLCVPMTLQNTELAGKVITLLGYESRQRVWPAYFDILLGQKLAADPDCQEMLKLVFENTVFDLGVTLNMRKIFQQMIIANSTDMASKWATEQARHQSELDKFLTAYEGYLS